MVGVGNQPDRNMNLEMRLSRMIHEQIVEPRYGQVTSERGCDLPNRHWSRDDSHSVYDRVA
jgi:hypothetical protein